MAAITIKDLHINRVLNRQARSSIRGAGAGWVYGWIRPYVDASPSFGSAVNLYQTNNFFHADQMINQTQLIDITNSAPNAIINVNPKQQAINLKLA